MAGATKAPFVPTSRKEPSACAGCASPRGCGQSSMPSSARRRGKGASAPGEESASTKRRPPSSRFCSDRKRFRPLPSNSPQSTPWWRRRASPTVEIEMDVIEAIHKRRSVRSYEPKPVERDLIEALMLDAAQAPPPRRGQSPPWVFNVVEGVRRIEAYGARAMDHARNHHPDEPGWDWLDRP